MPEIERRGLIFAQRQTIDNFQRESAQLPTALRVFTDDNIRLDHQIGDQAIYEDVVEGDIDQLTECLSDGGDRNSSLSGMSVHEGESDGGFANGKPMDEDVSGLIQDSLKTVYRCALCGGSPKERVSIVERNIETTYGQILMSSLSIIILISSYTQPRLMKKLQKASKWTSRTRRSLYVRDEDYLLPIRRSTTPLLEIDSARLQPQTVTCEYENCVSEYKFLLERGATRLMCENFSLRFSKEWSLGDKHHLLEGGEEVNVEEPSGDLSTEPLARCPAANEAKIAQVTVHEDKAQRDGINVNSEESLIDEDELNPPLTVAINEYESHDPTNEEEDYMDTDTGKRKKASRLGGGSYGDLKRRGTGMRDLRMKS
ncbi:hypothetical protein V5O48_004412 [Marasmius crinis-equi]|uniref:Uncharacterized protein n=1 Tax=Marasmius crinis-equi TaxID=585013 RepID=A0ABR3FQ74_9AGAR